MTHYLLNGNKILFVLIVLFMSSCNSTKKYSKYNFFNGADYYNDTLNINGRFFGDIDFCSPKSINKRYLKIISKDVSYKNLLVYGKTNTPPDYEIFMFLVKSKDGKPSKNETVLTNDSVNNIVLLKKEFINNDVFVLLKSIGKYKSNTSIMLDASSIINSINIGDTIKKTPTYSDIFNTYKDEDNILFLLEKFNSAPIEESKKNNWMKLQYLLTILSGDNQYALYEEKINDYERNRNVKLSEIIKKVKPNDSLPEESIEEKIKSISKDEKTVMLNEMHWKPEHRVLAYKLLKPLKDNGFKYLAVEAVDKELDSVLNSKGYPVQYTGYYTREPYFGLFLRKAHELGYTIIGYDDFSTDNRELAQAQAIKSIIDNDKDAKVFVYAGIDHILEGSSGNSVKRMAQYFNELSGINPLTIDQVELRFNSTESLLLNSNLFDNEKMINTNVDYFVINNIKASLEELYPKSTLKTVNIEDVTLSSYNEKEVFVSVYISDEYQKHKSNAVPVIKKIKVINDNCFNIDIPKGSYFLIVKDHENNLLIKETLSVD